jgi:general secretion pathway protein H
MDLPRRQFGLQGNPQRDVPQPLQVRAIVGNTELSPNQVAGILFLPDGGATGGSFDVLRPSGTGTRVRVDWLSGRVEQEPIVP